MKKRFLSILMAVSLLLSILPMETFAADNVDITYAVDGGNIHFDATTGTITDCDYWVTDADIPNVIEGVNVEHIGDNAFHQCFHLKSITIPESVKTIGEDAFNSSNSLTSIVIPDSVVSVGTQAFYNCTGLVSVELSSSLTSIEPFTFSGCKGLAAIEIPNGVTSIGSSAFYHCENLTHIEIPSSVNQIEDSAFGYCTNLKDVLLPDSLSAIADFTFIECSDLANIVIPQNVLYIGDDAFSECRGLKQINIPDKVTTIGIGAFYGCNSLKSIVIPDSVTSLGNAFSNCSSLTSVTIPASLNSQVFLNCSAVTHVKLTGSKPMYDYSGSYEISKPWMGCTNDVAIEIENSVPHIGNYAFYGCDKLTEITLPNSVASIGRAAFKNCSTLRKVTIPSSVTSLDSIAFEGCPELKTAGPIGGEYSYEFGWTTGIPDGAFRCNTLTSITIPSSITNIEKYAFCYDSLTDIYYAGSKRSWASISGDGKPSGENVTIHYRSTGPDDIGSDNMNPVYYLRNWNAATRTVEFGDDSWISPDTYTIADSVDVSNIGGLLNRYVLVALEQGDSSLEYTITDIQPVESKIGTVSATGEHSLTIDGTTHPVREDYVLGFLDGQDILYHVSNGTIVDFDVLEEAAGTLEAWDRATGRVTIDGKVYLTNYMSDLSALKSLDISSRPKIEYIVVKDYDYQPVLQLSVPKYETKVGVFTRYDSATNTAYIGGQSYPVNLKKCDLRSSSFGGKQVFFLLKNEKIIHVDSLEKVKSGLLVTTTPRKINVTYQDSKLSANEFDVGVSVSHSCTYSFPDNYDRAVIYAAAGLQPIKLNTVAWEGNNLNFSKSELSGATLAMGERKEGTVKISIAKNYAPKDGTETLVGTCITVGTPVGGTEISARGTVNIIVKNDSAQTGKPEDSSEVKGLAQQANDELKKTRIPFLLNRAIMKNTFGLSGKSLERFQQEMFTVIVMSEIPEQTLREKIDDKVLTKLFGKWKPDGISATNYTLPLVYEMETNDYGRVLTRFDCEIQAYNNPAFGMFINVYYTIISCENETLNAKHEFLGGGVNYNMQTFADTVWNLVEGELKSAYNIAWGNSANRLADWLFDDTVKKILNDKKTTFKDEVWKLCTWPAKNIVNKCPTNVYVYDETDTLCGAIEDNLVTKTDGSFDLYVEGDTKYIIGLEEGYTVQYVATDNGTMDVSVTEYAGYDTPMRQIEHLNVPLTVDGYYTQGISDAVKPQVETYALTTESQTALPPSNEETLLQLNPADDDPSSVLEEIGVLSAQWVQPGSSANRKLSIQLETEKTGEYILTVYDAAGKALAHYMLDKAAGGNEILQETVSVPGSAAYVKSFLLEPVTSQPLGLAVSTEIAEPEE